MLRVLVIICLAGVLGYPLEYETTNFKVGIEYYHSLPMEGGSDKYRHRNNFDPFFVTVTASARKGYVISYMEVSATVANYGEVDFTLVRGQTGSKSMVFQLVSNHSDFLSYNYLVYGIREEEYRKMANIIAIPITGNGYRIQFNSFTILTLLISCIIINL